MKKRFLLLGALAVCLNLNAQTTANTTKSDFATLYPTVARLNKDAIIANYFLNDIAVTSAMNSLLKQGEISNDKDIQQQIIQQIITWQKEVDCLENFGNTTQSKQLQNQLLKKIPANELQMMEQFLQTPQGQKMYSLLEDLIKSAKTGDFDKVEKFEETISKADKKAIEHFNQHHPAMIDSMDKVISSKQATEMIEKYRQSCQSVS